jgi:hypothetical protein
MTIEEAKKLINNSKFTKSNKTRLVLLINNLGFYALDGLAVEISKHSNLLIQDYIVELWQRFEKIYLGFKAGNKTVYNDFFELLNEFKNFCSWDEEVVFLLYLIMDFKSLITSKKISLSKDQQQKILEYELKIFWRLPKIEILDLMQNNLLFFNKNNNLFNLLQIAFLENDLDYKNDFINKLSESLIKNKEVLSNTVKTSIGNWINNFINFTNGGSVHFDVYGIAEFLFKSEEVKKLSSDEKNNLSEILKIFVWLKNPQIDEDQILALKQIIMDQEVSSLTEEFKKVSQNFKNNNISISNNNQYPLNIDAKLKALRSRVSNQKIKS